MSELTDLMAVYGAVDEAVVNDPDRRARVAELVPIYAEGGGGWYDDFRKWAMEKGAGDPPFPPLDEALRNLSLIAPSGRMRARRLYATAVAARAFPEFIGPRSESAQLVIGALSVETLAGDQERAAELLRLLADESALAPSLGGEAYGLLDGWWESIKASGLVADSPGLGSRPCRGRLVRHPQGNATVLETHFESEGIPFDRAIRFLHPVNWKACNRFWCEMTPVPDAVPAGVRRYHEVVSFACAAQAHAWTVEAYLDFEFSLTDAVATVKYDLSPGRPQPDLLIDHGVISVRRLGPAAEKKLEVKTSKHLRFDRWFSGEWLRVACLLGYGSVAEDLFECAAGDAAGTDFPAEEPVIP